MILPLILPISLSVILLGITLITLVNVLIFPRLDRMGPPAELPLVSIMVPARDEAAVIAETTRRLLALDYPNYELLILDDGSSDGTAGQALAAGEGDRRLRVLPGGDDLPYGWAGKNWACHRLSEAASGEVLLFTDADVRWEPDALKAVVSLMAREHADLVGVWPTQVTETWSERLIVPLMAFVILGYLPVWGVHHLPFASLAAANGQCMAWRRAAYHAVGGHAAVRGEVLEDVVMARRVKAGGLRLRIADAAGLLHTRMYTGWESVRDGYAKNLLAGYGESYLALLAATLFHWLVYLGPWAWLILGPLWPAVPGWPLWPLWPLWSLLLIALGVLTRALTAAATRQRPLDALLMPVSVLLMTAIAARSAYWTARYGGPRWKGRVVGGRKQRSG